jgi:hypothetical protein
MSSDVPPPSGLKVFATHQGQNLLERPPVAASSRLASRLLSNTVFILSRQMSLRSFSFALLELVKSRSSREETKSTWIWRVIEYHLDWKAGPPSASRRASYSV